MPFGDLLEIWTQKKKVLWDGLLNVPLRVVPANMAFLLRRRFVARNRNCLERGRNFVHQPCGLRRPVHAIFRATAGRLMYDALPAQQPIEPKADELHAAGNDQSERLYAVFRGGPAKDFSIQAHRFAGLASCLHVRCVCPRRPQHRAQPGCHPGHHKQASFHKPVRLRGITLFIAHGVRVPCPPLVLAAAQIFPALLHSLRKGYRHVKYTRSV